MYMYTYMYFLHSSHLYTCITKQLSWLFFFHSRTQYLLKKDCLFFTQFLNFYIDIKHHYFLEQPVVVLLKESDTRIYMHVHSTLTSGFNKNDMKYTVYPLVNAQGCNHLQCHRMFSSHPWLYLDLQDVRGFWLTTKLPYWHSTYIHRYPTLSLCHCYSVLKFLGTQKNQSNSLRWSFNGFSMPSVLLETCMSEIWFQKFDCAVRTNEITISHML